MMRISGISLLWKKHYVMDGLIAHTGLLMGGECRDLPHVRRIVPGLNSIRKE